MSMKWFTIMGQDWVSNVLTQKLGSQLGGTRSSTFQIAWTETWESKGRISKGEVNKTRGRDPEKAQWHMPFARKNRLPHLVTHLIKALLISWQTISRALLLCHEAEESSSVPVCHTYGNKLSSRYNP